LFGHEKCVPRFLQSSQRAIEEPQDGQANDVPPSVQSRPQLTQDFITQNTFSRIMGSEPTNRAENGFYTF